MTFDYIAISDSKKPPPEDAPALASGIDPTDRQAVLRAFDPHAPQSLLFRGTAQRLSASRKDLDAINGQHSEEALKEGDLAIFERYSANDALMRSPLKFTKRALEKFAADFTQGRGVHAQSALPPLGHMGFQTVGRTFRADVVKATVRGLEANWLRIRFYVVKSGASEERLQLLRDIETGILGYDSISFLAGAWNFQEVESPDGQTRYFFEIDDEETAHPRLEATEVSVLSELGNVYGAGSQKGKSLAGPTVAEASLSARGLHIPVDPYAAYRGGTPSPSATPLATKTEEADPYAGFRGHSLATETPAPATRSTGSIPDPADDQAGAPGSDPYAGYR